MNAVSAITIPNIGIYEIKDATTRKNLSDLSTSTYRKTETSSAVELDEKFLTCCDREQVSSIFVAMVDDVLNQEYGS